MSKKKNPIADTDSPPPSPRPLAEIEAEIQKVQQKQSDAPSYNRDQHNKLRGQLDVLEGEADVARATAIPTHDGNVPVPHFARLLVKSVDGNGNHRDASRQREDKLIEMTKSLEASGQLQPIAVRDNPAPLPVTLIFGFNRMEAARRLGWEYINALVYPNDTTNAQVEAIRAAENIHRQQLNFLEEATAVAATIARLEEAHGASSDPSDIDFVAAVAGSLGKSETWVRDRMYLSRLAAPVRKLVADGRLNLKQAREIAKIADPEAQEQLANQASFSADGTGGTSPEALRKIVNEQMYSLKTVPWQLDVAFGKYPDGRPAPACEQCPFNTINDLNLFEHDPAGNAEATKDGSRGLCTCPGCFDGKRKLSEQAIEKGVKKAVAHVEKTLGGVKMSTKEAALYNQPEIVKPATFERQVQKAIKPPAPKATKQSSTTDRYEKTPEEQAKERLRLAEDGWSESIEDELAKLINQNGWAEALWRIICSYVGIDEYGWLADGAEKRLKQPAIQDALMKLGFSPSASDVEKLISAIKYTPEVEVSLRNELIEQVGAATGMQIKPRPALKDFLPRKPVTSTKPGEVTLIKKGSGGKVGVTKRTAKPKSKSGGGKTKSPKAEPVMAGADAGEEVGDE